MNQKQNKVIRMWYMTQVAALNTNEHDDTKKCVNNL